MQCRCDNAGMSAATPEIPNVIEALDYETILTRRKAAFVARWPQDQQQAWRDTLALESSPVTKVLEESAYLELLLRTRINHAARANLLAFATDRDLDRLADFYGLTRAPAKIGTDFRGNPTRNPGESDEAFRARIRERVRGSSTAGPAAHYRWHALSASPAIRDAHVDSPRPGLVRVSITGHDGAVDDALLAHTRDYLNRTDIRVLTDTLEVRAATVKTIDIAATLWLLPDGNADLLNTLPATLRRAVGSQLGLGRDLTRSWLIHTLHAAGVQRVVLTAPARDVVIAADETAAIGTVTLNLGGRDY